MLQEEVAHPGSTWPRCMVTLCKVKYKTFTLRWKKTGRKELKRPEKQCSAFGQVNQKSQDNLPAGGPGSQAAVRPEGVRYIPLLCQRI